MLMKAVKPLTYSTRRLLPGDEFEAKPRDAKVLLATRKVKSVRAPADVPAPPAEVAAKIVAAMPPQAAADLVAARADYEKALGKRPFMGWGADELRRRIAEAKAGA